MTCDDEAEVQLTDLRFFVSDVVLITDEGNEVPVALDADTNWQNGNVALVDLEDASGNCLNGSVTSNAVVRGTVPEGNYSGLAFTVGVPEKLNHADPLTATAPLTISAMHWHWRSGYKFLRAGIKTGNDGFWMHLGSARCHGVIGNLQGCDASNRVNVVLDGFHSDTDIVVFDFAGFIESVDLSDGNVDSCQMGPDENACEAMLAPLGLDWRTGDSVAMPTVFRVAPQP